MPISRVPLSLIAASKKHSDTALLVDTQATQLPSVNRLSGVFHDGGVSDGPLADPPLLGEPGHAFETILSEIRSVHAKLDELSGRLRVVEDAVAQVKQGQVLDMDANQQWKTQVANEVAKISQQQDIGENL